MSSWAAPAVDSEDRQLLLRPTVAIERAAPCAKLLLLGEAPALKGALPEGIGIPLHPNTVAHTEGLGVCLWLRPEQRLLLLAAAPARADIDERIRAMNGPEAWALDAGARYLSFAVTGSGAAALLNAGCSLDLREAAFAVQSCAQSRFDQIPVLLFRKSHELFEIFAERPLAPHLWRWLCRAADNS